MNIISRFIIANGVRFSVSELYPYHSDGISRPTLRIYIPFETATFDDIYNNIMNNATEIEEWAIVEENDAQVEKHLTTHTNYTNSSSAEYNKDDMYPNHWVIDIVRKTHSAMIEANELALLDVFEAVIPSEEE